jgi:hypothetical protein
MNPSYTVPALPSHPQGAAQSLPYRQYLTDLSTSLFSFVLPLLPTAEELATKEEVRGLIERLIKTIEPSSRLASFGSSCNSFGLRNSGESVGGAVNGCGMSARSKGRGDDEDWSAGWQALERRFQRHRRRPKSRRNDENCKRCSSTSSPLAGRDVVPLEPHPVIWGQPVTPWDADLQFVNACQMCEGRAVRLKRMEDVRVPDVCAGVAVGEAISQARCPVSLQMCRDIAQPTT